MKFNISKYKKYLEGNRLEVIDARHGLPDDLWKTYSAMANTNGGVILFGVMKDDDGVYRTTGVYDEKEFEYEFWSNLNNSEFTNVNVLLKSDVERIYYNCHTVYAIHVPRARREDKPVYVREGLATYEYLRDKEEGTRGCTFLEEEIMRLDRCEETADMKVLEDMSMLELNLDTVHAYRNRHKSYRPGHVWEDLEDDEYLEMIGAAKRSRPDGELHPTAAGLLMFGEVDSILFPFPKYSLDYHEVLDPAIGWTDRLQSSSGDWTGNLFDFFFKVNSKMSKDLKIPFKLEGITRIDDTPAHKALREALVNCLVNTGFNIPGGIVIKKDQDTIILENPGSIRTGKDQMLKGGISDPRNKAIMKMFNLIGIGQHEGSGIPYILSVWGSQGWSTPEVEEQCKFDRTILKLSFEKKDEEKPSLNHLESTSFNTTE